MSPACYDELYGIDEASRLVLVGLCVSLSLSLSDHGCSQSEYCLIIVQLEAGEIDVRYSSYRACIVLLIEAESPRPDKRVTAPAHLLQKRVKYALLQQQNPPQRPELAQAHADLKAHERDEEENFEFETPLIDRD